MSDQTPTPPTDPTQPIPPAAPAQATPPAPAPAAPAPAQATPPAAVPPAAAPPAAAPPTPPAAAPAAAPPQAAAPVTPPPAPTAYAVPPGAPGGPGYGAVQGAPPPSGGYFASGKNKTIALIVGGVFAIGAIGGVAALLAGGGDEEKVDTSASAPAGSGVLDPAPVENTDPAPAEPTETTEPAPETTAPAPETTAPETTAPAPAPAPPAGDSVVLGGNVAVPVPAGWEVFGSDDTSVAMGSGNDFVYAVLGTVKPSDDAGQVLANSLESILPPEQYTDLRTSDVVPQQPGGAIVSMALLEYEAIWTDGQGTVPLHGAMFAAIRQDGTALIILGEHSPPDDFTAAFDQNIAPILNGALSGFAGLAQ